MTTAEREFVNRREAMLDEVLDYIASHEGTPLYQDDVIRGLEERFPESLVISAVWRLIDQHRIDLDRKLALVVPANA